MLLKNLMEDKQLNFDQPFLSVRRHSPTVYSQKRDNRRIDSYSHQVKPHLPTYRSELESGPITNPGTVPFLWEQSPGQPKEETEPQTRNFHKPPIAPKFPPGRAKHQDRHDVSRNTTGSNNQVVNVPCASENKKQDLDISSESRSGSSNDENVKCIECNKDTEEEEERSDSGDSDEAYVDALDSLSRAESYFLNCSMSGLSGLGDSDVKPSGSFMRDPQTQEFMMDRFLPAAKAMASETPHAPKKQPVQAQVQQPNKTADHCKPSLRYGPSFAKRYAYYQDNIDEEESDDEYDQQANLPSVCGLLPRFCLKSSLCLLSPVPAMSVRTRLPTSSASKVRPGFSSAGSYSELENESRSDGNEVESTEKIRIELDEDKAKLRSDRSKFKMHTLSFLVEKVLWAVYEENMHTGTAGFGLHSKGLKTFQEFLDDRGSPNESNSEDPVVEKTLYVDTIQKVESPTLLIEEEDAVKTRTEQMHAMDSSQEYLKRLPTVDGDENFLPNDHKIDISAENCGMEKPQDFEETQDFNLDSTSKDDLVTTTQQAMESSENQLSREGIWDNSKQNSYGLPAPPPLPKSPSDSWLWRTLPSMTAKHSSLRPNLGAVTKLESHCFKAPTSDMKWETIVKTAKVQSPHMHYSELHQESLTTIPEA